MLRSFPQVVVFAEGVDNFKIIQAHYMGIWELLGTQTHTHLG